MGGQAATFEEGSVPDEGLGAGLRATATTGSQGGAPRHRDACIGFAHGCFGEGRGPLAVRAGLEGDRRSPQTTWTSMGPLVEGRLARCGREIHVAVPGDASGRSLTGSGGARYGADR